MVFKCQEDSFLKEYSSEVVSCEKSQFTVNIDGKDTNIDGYEVILEETILFPEGGGQPADHGFLNESKVYEVKRRGKDAIHFVDKPLEVKENVKQTIDWNRRFDHMQQHSGQHLITAVFERDFGFATGSWWLGDQVSHVELDCPSLTSDQITRAENTINELIRLNTNVTVEVFKSADDLGNVHTRGLPDDHVGDVRVITIEGIESNMCCGTHVTNLGQLQVVKLLNTEKSKRKNKTLLYFLVGNRVMQRLSACLDREQQLTVLLKNNPSEHAQLVEKLQKNVRVISKDLKNVLKDLAIFEAQKFKSILPEPAYYTLHRKEGDSDFMNIFIKEIGSAKTFFFISVGEDKGSGNVMMYGDNAVIQKLGNNVMEVLNGKGAGNGNRFQGKVAKIENRSKIIQMLQEHFK